MAVIDRIDRVDYWTAATFFKILLSDEIIGLDDKLEKIIKYIPKEGFIWTHLMKSYNSVEHEINLSLLNKTELVSAKTYLLMRLLQLQNDEISLRLLELLIKACVHGRGLKCDESIILLSPENNLRKFGEYALKTLTISFDSEEMIGTYGKINIGVESEYIEKYKEDEKYDDIGCDEFDDEDLYFDDDLFEDFE